ncbi:PREDICTED: thrombospondin type-1 domain-containing protein 7B-like [Priapulus caudatus]|uniref:Thrombospondin type-1 domain-containing protein 7B-like n=1 Tax=Priapulus caudatus TaxID=37621 RepID=A0ABM1EF77_PRICU|nr:PREDICTED: thrombospondin type-1 domain-containing protein 7B-like [Priapulus caudatus]
MQTRACEERELHVDAGAPPQTCRNACTVQNSYCSSTSGLCECAVGFHASYESDGAELRACRRAMRNTSLVAGSARHDASVEFVTATPAAKVAVAAPKLAVQALGVRVRVMVNSECTGRRYRPLACHDSNGRLVDHSMCSTTGYEEQACFVQPCAVDCVVSVWSPWSVCADPCHGGTSNRSRSIVVNNYDGGRLCPEQMTQFKTCPAVCNEYVWTSGDWSPCQRFNSSASSRNSVDGECGWKGTQSRRIVCVHQSSEGLQQTVADDLCDVMVKPIGTASCHQPCAGECVMSHWGQWSPCAEQCLAHEKRYSSRQVERVSDHSLCGEKTQTMQCPCFTYRWQFDSWSTCIQQLGAECGHGWRYRHLLCLRDDDRIADRSFCLQNATLVMEPTEELCHLPCPIDCITTEWSAWDGTNCTCGLDSGTISRRRLVIQSPADGGRQCRRTVETRACKIKPCYRWERSAWSQCVVRDADCGEGMRRRNISCIATGDVTVSNSLCLSAHASMHDYTLQTDVDIHTEEPCYIPCAFDCQMTPWTEWSACNRNCKVNSSVGIATRSRAITHHPTPLTAPCPDVLWQTKACAGGPCLTYSWNKTRGADGNEEMACTRSDGLRVNDLIRKNRTGFCICTDLTAIYSTSNTTLSGDIPVSWTFCGEQPAPVVAEQCAVPCPVDCELSRWSPWLPCPRPSTCSQLNKTYVTTRIRSANRQATEGGAACPHLEEVASCAKVTACHSWHTGALSKCMVEDLKKNCGPGLMYRTVYCVNIRRERVNDTICFDNLMNPMPSNSVACSVPCAGDCVLSQWSQWSACSQACFKDTAKGMVGGVQERTRGILAQSTDGSPCPTSDELRVVRTCYPERSCDVYHWQGGPWDACAHSNQVVPEFCGRSKQFRDITCVKNEGEAVPNSRCDTLPMPPSNQSCNIQCSVDCQISGWSQWSTCDQICPTERLQFRSRGRYVMQPLMYSGKACPSAQREVILCQPQCHSFSWVYSEFGACLLPAGVTCGEGIRGRDGGLRVTRVLAGGGKSCPHLEETERLDSVEVNTCHSSLPMSREIAIATPSIVDVSCTSVPSRSMMSSIKMPYAFCCPHVVIGKECGDSHLAAGFVWVSTKMDLFTYFCNIFAIVLLQVKCLQSYIDLREKADADKSFSWRTGPWGACVGEQCGLRGMETRVVICINKETGSIMRDEQCDEIKKPASLRTCFIVCEKHRHEVSWRIEPWTRCIHPGTLSDSRCEFSTQGLQYRSVKCVLNMTNALLSDHVCEHFFHKPPRKRTCDIPCPQNCVVAEFGEWSACDCRRNQTRTRRIVIAPSGGGKACPPLSEARRCVSKNHHEHKKHGAQKVSTGARDNARAAYRASLEDMSPQDRRWWHRNQFTIFKREAPAATTAAPPPGNDKRTHGNCSHEQRGAVLRGDGWTECASSDEVNRWSQRSQTVLPVATAVKPDQTVAFGSQTRRLTCRDSDGAVLERRSNLKQIDREYNHLYIVTSLPCSAGNSRLLPGLALHD